MKVVRIQLVFKYIKREVNRLIHPRVVKSVKIGGAPVQEEVLSGIMAFTTFYMFAFVATTLLMTMQGYDLVSSASAVATTIGNVGPGFGMVGPATTYSALSGFSKLLLSFCMILAGWRFTRLLRFYPLVSGNAKTKRDRGRFFVPFL